MVNQKPGWKIEMFSFHKIHVVDSAAVIANEMRVIFHVGTISGGPPINIDLAHKVALDQRIQAVINRRHRDVRVRLFGPHEYFLGGGMILFLEQGIVDMLALNGKAQAAGGQAFVQVTIARFVAIQIHEGRI